MNIKNSNEYSSKSLEFFWGNLKGKEQSWYKKGNEYWENVEKDFNGVMGGYGDLNKVDIENSA